MSMVGGIGSGTFCIIFFGALLIVIAIIGYATKVGKIIFWGAFLLLFVIFIGLVFCPRESEKKSEPTNKKWILIPVFATLCYLGVIVAIAAYFIVVLTYQDTAYSIPS